MAGKVYSSKASCLLGREDVAPVELLGAGSVSSVLLVCEHAGKAIPKSLGGLGLSLEERAQHIAFDIGARDVACDLAELLDCTLILQRYSRLVVDCNRPPGSLQSIPIVSDKITIPANQSLSDADRKKRELAIFSPYAELCQSQIGRREIHFTFSVHSFTPRMDGKDRPWDVGFLYRSKCSEGDHLMRIARGMWPNLVLGHNEPYRIEDQTDWYIPVCAEPRNIPHCLIEIRNDHLKTKQDCTLWAQRLHQLISRFIEQ